MSENTKYTFDEMTLEKCFKSFYIVPDYQREYVWQADVQVARLLADVTDAYEENPNKEYFVGTAVVSNNRGFYELVDGQQRITTLFMILCAFRNIYQKRGFQHRNLDRMIYDVRTNSDGDEVEAYRVELQYESSTDVLRRLAEEAEIDVETLWPSGRRLFEAYKSIEQELSQVEDIRKLFVYFKDKLKFIQITTPDISDALKIFETINNRGVGLTPLDLLKNLVFRQVARDKFEPVKQKWQELISTLEEAGEKPLRFLRYFIISNFPREKQAGTNQKDINMVREEEIYSWMTENENKADCRYDKDPVVFINMLIENARAFVNFANGLDAKGNPNVYLKNINVLGGNNFLQHIILLLTARKFNTEMFNILARNIENYLFVSFVTRVRSNAFETTFARWNIDLKDVKTKDELLGFVADHILPEVDKKKGEFEARFLSLSENDLTRYRLKYILGRTAQYVDSAHGGASSLAPLDSYCSPSTEIEHILPQSPLNEEMKAQFEDYDRSKSMLGNLTLIEKTMNAVIKNWNFEEKVKKYGSCPVYLTSSIASLHEIGAKSSVIKINGYLKTFDHWDRVAIEERQKMLYELARLIWKIDGTEKLFSSSEGTSDEGAPFRHLSVILSDGRVIDHAKASETFVETIRAIGLDKVHGLGMSMCRVALVGKKKSQRYQQADAGDGWLVMTNTDTRTKKSQLERIAKALHIKLKVILTEKPKAPKTK